MKPDVAIGVRLESSPLSIAKVARLAGVPYAKLIRAERLTTEQLARVVRVLDEAQLQSRDPSSTS